LFDEAGLSYPPGWYGATYNLNGVEVEWSWDTLKEVAKLLTVDTSGRNATQTGFNKDAILQYGFTWQWEIHPNYFGSFWSGGSMLAPGGYPGNYQAQAPEAWVDAWKWTYEGIWGKQPWMAKANVESSAEFDNGNPFDSGKVAMVDQPVWFTCCISNVTWWEVAAMPSYNGVVGGRIDADTFRIWKGTRHPQEAFEALAYLVGEGTQKLIIGSTESPAVYGAMPARPEYQPAWLDAKREQFPWVQNWYIFIDGLSFPDVPSAESWMPNFNEAWNRGYTFGELLRNTSGLNLDQEIATYLADLEAIFNR
jgi:multiple sugar transport system substrate-binding protein